MSVDELADRGAVFEIGRTLREARTRLGLDLAEVERRTRIQARFLVALEEERFELLPGDAYARGFLRSYAEALGLDGQLFLDEYKARFGERAQSALAPPRQVERMRRPALPALVLASVVLAIAGLAGLLSSACGTAARSSATRAPRRGQAHTGPRRADRGRGGLRRQRCRFGCGHRRVGSRRRRPRAPRRGGPGDRRRPRHLLAHGDVRRRAQETRPRPPARRRRAGPTVTPQPEHRHPRLQGADRSRNGGRRPVHGHLASSDGRATSTFALHGSRARYHVVWITRL
jgi:hypothetical protein